MISKAKTVDEFLAGLPDDRREALQAILTVFRKNIGKGFEEGVQYGMIGYYVPHKLYPPGYHCDPKQPLPFAGMASQKNHMAVYMSCLYSDSKQDKEFRAAWKKTGKKLDDVALDVIGDAIARVSVKDYISMYEAVKPAGKRTR